MQLSMDRINEIFSAVALVRARPARRQRSAVGEGGEGGARPQSRGGPMEGMEWTGLTAAQIIRLSTSQFAYTGGWMLLGPGLRAGVERRVPT